MAELGDVTDDLGAESRGVGFQFAADLEEAGSDLGVEMGELVWDLGQAGILWCGRRFADQQIDDGEEGDDLEDKEGGEHSAFLRLEGYHPALLVCGLFPNGNLHQ